MPWRRANPDRDPLAISPHERFEEVSRGEAPVADNQIDTYENVIRKMAKPVMVTAAERGLYAWGEIVETIARISWAYRVPREQVEADLITEGNRQLSEAILGAALNGLMVESQPDENGRHRRLSKRASLKALQGRSSKQTS